MKHWQWLAGVLLLAATAVASADRVPTTRSPGQRSNGVRPDITVPYTTDGRSAFMIDGRVSPRIYSSPIMDDPKNPQSKPVFNLIFYGSVQSFGDRSEGATPRTR
jgi:hypothetical protein